jgi:arginyl-tRNA synthetase
VLRALSEIDKNIADKTMHLSHGMLKLATGKMSSRKGNVITGESLIDDVEALVAEKIKDKGYTEAQAKEVIEKVSIGAIKYSILRQSPGSDIVFDFDTSVSFEGDSGPYLQYTSVRAGSILEKAEGLELSTKVGLVPFEISDLEKILYRLPKITARALAEHSPHYIVNYLTQVASMFNSWYAQTKIVDEKDPYTPYKLAVTLATKKVLDTGLMLLGIQTPTKM